MGNMERQGRGGGMRRGRRKQIIILNSQDTEMVTSEQGPATGRQRHGKSILAEEAASAKVPIGSMQAG